jgi:uncharacterized protein YukE
VSYEDRYYQAEYDRWHYEAAQGYEAYMEMMQMRDHILDHYAHAIDFTEAPHEE